MPQNPPPIIENGLMLITQKLSRSDQSHVSQLTMAVVAGAVPPTPQTMLNNFQAAFNAHITPNLDTEVTALKPTAIYGVGTNVPEFYEATGATAPGLVNFISLPPQVALLCKKITATAGKRGRGRWYVPFCLSQGNVDQTGKVTGGTIITDWTTGLSQFVAILVSQYTIPCLAHRVYSGKVVTAINKGPNITSMVPEAYVATQRRRLKRP